MGSTGPYGLIVWYIFLFLGLFGSFGRGKGWATLLVAMLLGVNTMPMHGKNAAVPSPPQDRAGSLQDRVAGNSYVIGVCLILWYLDGVHRRRRSIGVWKALAPTTIGERVCLGGIALCLLLGSLPGGAYEPLVR